MSLNRMARRAFTLIECITAIVLLAIVGAAITTTVQKQGRVYRAATELTELQDQLNEGAGILASDLRNIAPAGGDIYPGTMGKSSIEFRSAFGFSVACEISAGNSIALPSNGGSPPGTRLTYMYKAPEAGNGLFILDDGPSEDPADDAWLFRIIVSVTSYPGACSAGPFASARDWAVPGLRVSLNAALPATVTTGAPVRFVERVRYALYQSSDGKWYLGYCASSTMATSCASLQPVSGPYLTPNVNQASGQSGLDFHYLDANGSPTSDPLSVTRMDIVLRGVVSGNASLAGAVTATSLKDTVRLSVELRNR